MMTSIMTLPIIDHHLKTEPSVVTTELPMPIMSLDALRKEVYEVLERKLNVDSLLAISRRFQAELRQHMQDSPQSMLPSFNYTLPTGEEEGTYLAVEVGGSNLRVALVELQGRSQGSTAIKVRRTVISPITLKVKALPGYAFFDWMAREIRNMLEQEGETREGAEPLRMGVAWSFPVDQTSMRSGNVLGMGKGFVCSDLVKDHDLGDIFTQAFEREHVNVHLDAVVNDTSSSLLARAYLDPTTRVAIVLGTGVNAAIHLPVSALHKSKFKARPVKPGDEDTHVLVNTELSMFGKNILPTSRWDEILNSAHMVPDYQPLEYLIAGGYMGEIVRLIMVEAADMAGLYDGVLPKSLRVPYSLDTKTIADIQVDTSAHLSTTRSLLQHTHPSPHPPSIADAKFMKQIIASVGHRSIAYFATAIHALTSLLQELDAETGPFDHLSISCDGSVINKYPAYMRAAQEKLDEMWTADSNECKRTLLEGTQDGAVTGAGVAGALGALVNGPVKPLVR